MFHSLYINGEKKNYGKMHRISNILFPLFSFSDPNNTSIKTNKQLQTPIQEKKPTIQAKPNYPIPVTSPAEPKSFLRIIQRDVSNILFPFKHNNSSNTCVT